MGLSIGLDTAISGLRAMQLAIDTAAHNVANADTQGYSRQEVVFRAIPPVQDRNSAPNAPLRMLGMGVDSGRIRRLRDTLLDVQYRDAHRIHEQYHAEATALGQAEVILNEPSDQGLQQLMAGFFNTFRDLTSRPESIAARAAAVEQGATLAASFNRAGQMLVSQRSDLDASIEVKVTEINKLAGELAELNKQIRMASVSGVSANDLMDRRDVVLDELAGLAGVTVQNGADDTVDVYLGARALVSGTTVDALAAVPDPLNANLRQVVWASDSAASGITSGEIAGILKSRDVHVTGLLNALDELAQAIIAGVNAHHQNGTGLDGTTGLDFFTGTGALDVAVNQTLRDEPGKLGIADAIDEPGNANTARLIAGVQNELLLGGGTTTVEDFYRATVATLGVNSQQAMLQRDNQDLLARHIDTARQSVMGVSLDEEMTNLMKGQHAYQAVAKVISTVDEILDTLINRTA